MLDKMLNQAMQQIARGKLKPATTLLLRCIRTDPKYPPCHRALAMVYDHLGATQKAVAENRLFLRLTHQQDDAQSLQGLMLPMAPALLGGPSFDDD